MSDVMLIVMWSDVSVMWCDLFLNKFDKIYMFILFMFSNLKKNLQGMAAFPEKTQFFWQCSQYQITYYTWDQLVASARYTNKYVCLRLLNIKYKLFASPELACKVIGSTLTFLKADTWDQFQLLQGIQTNMYVWVNSISNTNCLFSLELAWNYRICK
jgi:hypothetical protein